MFLNAMSHAVSWIKDHQAPLASWLTVFILLTTLLWALIVEVPKRRRRVIFAKVKHLKYQSNETGVEVKFFNHCMRELKNLQIYDISSHRPLEWEVNYNSKTLGEGDWGDLGAFFRNEQINLDDILRIRIMDSVRKKYPVYLRNGEVTNKWLGRLLFYFNPFRIPKTFTKMKREWED
jgi:hypothetical protein